jgi:hypothetical protein
VFSRSAARFTMCPPLARAQQGRSLTRLFQKRLRACIAIHCDRQGRESVLGMFMNGS